MQNKNNLLRTVRTLWKAERDNVQNSRWLATTLTFRTKHNQAAIHTVRKLWTAETDNVQNSGMVTTTLGFRTKQKHLLCSLYVTSVTM